MSQQLTLDVRLREQPSFTNFIVGENEQLLNSLQAVSCAPAASMVYLWGQLGCGRTHLLQASCVAAESLNQRALYIDLNEHEQYSPKMLDGAEELMLLCLDNMEAVCGLAQWEEAIFDCYHRLLDRKNNLLVAANDSALEINLSLLDLTSRLRAGTVYHVKPLSDEQKLTALKLHATSRGLVLNDQVGNYLLAHFPRDMGSLLTILEQLDQASLAQQRQLTVQFVKSSMVGVKF